MTYSLLPQLKRNYSGQTFVEIIISVGLAGMVLASILILNTASSKVGASSLKRSQANKIAVLALESARYYRDSQTYAKLSAGCYKITTEQLASQPLTSTSCSNYETVNFEGNIFQRKIEIASEDTSTSSRKVTVTVRWPEATGISSGGENYKQVVLNTNLSRW